jgi:hypothetical protein
MRKQIWPVVVENLAEQLASVQGGVVHPVQLLPFLPLSLSQIEQTLDALASSDFVEKDRTGDLVSYHFPQFADNAPAPFQPERCVFSNVALPHGTGQVLSEDVIRQMEAELSALAEGDPWPAEANWQHELVFLLQHIPGPVRLSHLAGHSRMSFRMVEEKAKQLAKVGAASLDPVAGTLELPPLSYPQSQYERQAAFVRQFPGALREEYEVRLVRALVSVVIVMSLTFALVFILRVPFILLLVAGGLVSAFTFWRQLKAPPKPLPQI